MKTKWRFKNNLQLFLKFTDFFVWSTVCMRWWETVLTGSQKLSSCCFDSQKPPKAEFHNAKEIKWDSERTHFQNTFPKTRRYLSKWHRCYWTKTFQFVCFWLRALIRVWKHTVLNSSQRLSVPHVEKNCSNSFLDTWIILYLPLSLWALAILALF